MNSGSNQLGNGTRTNDIEEQAPKVGKAASVKESTTKTSSDSRGNSLLWDWNRIKKWVNSLPWDWNLIVILVRMIALSLEPLFLYGLMINEYKKCVEIDRKLGITAIVSRSILDISYLVLRFHTGFLGYQFRKYRKKIKNHLVKVRINGATSRSTEIRGPTGPTPVKDKWQTDLRKYILHRHFLFDILVFLPIPQVVMFCILLDVRAMKSLKTLQILNIFIFFQYWPRVFQIYLPRKDLGSNHEILGERLWVLGPLDFFLYIIAGHVLGAFWYCFSIQRTVACWYMACKNLGGCVRNSFYYCDHDFRYHSVLDEFCPKNMPNAELFDFGVYLDAHQSKILESKNIPQKIFYCFCWGMRNLSSFGSNLQISSDVWENCFVLCITIFGLLLFLYYMGNFQIYLQRRITSKSIAELQQKKKSIAEAAKRKVESINLWIENKKFRTETSSEIINIVQKKFHEEEDIYVEILISELPAQLQWDVKNEICFEPLKQLMNKIKNSLDNPEHEKLLRDICNSLKPVYYNEQCYIVREGEPMDAVFLITDGSAWAFQSSSNGEGTGTASRCAERLEAGHFFGEELLELFWEPSSTNMFNPSKVPIYSKSLKTHTKVEAFALMANELLKRK
ncbi:cyclic nucleotide-gated ion channel 1-like isoform X1 [Quercus lobata]|uniref:Cyclic nucleotide-binding domain-containing protein n=1 Tax=Quercus lobata TaxID=97700 RepID=A0A7N2MUP5_QUELO|nr:cyclic nucleotide-gated ion channel 1-like isoform X1 [Quercus lobata]XP_030944922.1 cyclic nucleotide-gated ion channel 1-like isoform X1 [Quercus lobata]XP_030944923.1 cyclic nucleotide-gated ion channel 1-like isoform X1 [Quercus lobata]XP_030944924.1 cyclic nucleotide-gated ion channel 1-like isoform X1 [Quercus lobata]XP_030944925.1 cyclic nucleotide-gated ion channel 1-like isoform X2 [Quercus lobata]XP_030944926.1 cyclic nucleotide-gated ion channel 1-like isoform X1 [Quercus lobata]